MKATINNFVTILLVSVVLSLLVGVSDATWCNNDYAKRVNVSVNNTAGSALTDYQVYVNLSANPINETSLRVYNSSDCTSRDFWCEEISSGNCTKLWINYSVITASTWTNNTAIYYDNAAASSTSNITSTFLFGDDFENVVDTFVEVWDSGIIASGTADNPRNMVIDGNYLYGVSDQSAKLVIYTISNPNSPTQQSLISMSYGGHDIRKSGNYVFISTAEPGTTPGLMIYNVSNVTSPSHVTNLDLGGQGHGMFLSGNYLYVCMHVADKFVIVDISNPESPVEKGSLTGTTYFNGAHDVHVDGNYAYVSNYQATTGQYGFVVVNVSDKNNPAVVAYSGNDHSNSHIMKVGNYCYVGVHDDNGMTIYDVSTPTSPVYKGRFFESEGLLGYWIDVYNSTTLAITGGSKIHLVDITTPDSPSILRTKTTVGGVANIAIDGEYFYLSVSPNDDWKIMSYEFGTDYELDYNKWTVDSGSPTLVASTLVIQKSGTVVNMKSKDKNWTYNVALRTKAKMDIVSSVLGGYINFGDQYAYPSVSDMAYFYPYSDGNLYKRTYKDTVGGNSNSSAFNELQYYLLDITWISTKCKFNIDDGTPWETTTQIPDSACALQLEEHNGGKIILDWILVRKYATPEPSTTLGSEEQQGTDTSFTVTLPSGYTHLKFEPSNSTAQNVTPNGQTDSQEFYNVTNTGDVNLDIRLKLNETVSSIELKADSDNNPLGAKEVNTTLVTIYSDLATTNSANIWLWSDFSHTVEQDTNKTISINVTQSA